MMSDAELQPHSEACFLQQSSCLKADAVRVDLQFSRTKAFVSVCFAIKDSLPNTQAKDHYRYDT